MNGLPDGWAPLGLDQLGNMAGGIDRSPASGRSIPRTATP